MKVKRYIASTSRDALRQVKEELGADAVILSNKKTRDGVEIMALADAEMSGLAQSSSPVCQPATDHAQLEASSQLSHPSRPRKPPDQSVRQKLLPMPY